MKLIRCDEATAEKLKELVALLNDKMELGKMRQTDAITYAIDDAIKNLKK